MSKLNVQFCEYLDTVEKQYQDIVAEINEYLTDNGCKCEIKEAKSGFVVSYIYGTSKRTIASFVSRKTGMKIRIYAEHLAQYADLLDTFPQKMKQEIKKSSVCKRLINPNDCNPKCIKGYDFFMDNEHYQKCRYMAFMPTLNEENNPFIKCFLEKEISALREK